VSESVAGGQPTIADTRVVSGVHKKMESFLLRQKEWSENKLILQLQYLHYPMFLVKSFLRMIFGGEDGKRED
jgi:hypothetical protein